MTDTHKKTGFKLALMACVTMLPTFAFAQDLEPPNLDMQDLLQEVEEAPEAPGQGELNSPDAIAEPSADDDFGNAQAVPVPSASMQELSGLQDAEDAAATSGDFDEDVFFDAEELVPTGEMGRKAGPKKVDPRVSPASRFVVVRENHSAGSKTSQLVAAERAIKLGRYDSALEIYDRLYVTNKRDPNILMGRAITLQKLGRNDEAVSAYEQLLTLRPDNVEAQVNMIGLMADRYPSVALRRLDEMGAQHRNNVALVAQAAFIHAKLANFQEAIRYLGMAASMEPQNANHIYNMAVIADRAGSKNEAVKYYEKALEVDTLYGAGKTIPRESVYQRLAQLR